MNKLFVEAVQYNLLLSHPDGFAAFRTYAGIYYWGRLHQCGSMIWIVGAYCG